MAEIHAPITGNVWQVLAEPGHRVAHGDTVAIIESMKLEIPVESEVQGIVTQVLVTVGDAVGEGDVMFVLE